MGKTIDYYYAIMSGFAYLGEPELRRIAAQAGATINYCPVDILSVFASSGITPPPKQSDARRAYRAVELERWGDVRGLPVNTAPKFWPVAPKQASLMVLAATALGHDPGELSSAFLRGVWVEDKDISDADQIKAILTDVFPNAASEILAKANDPQIEARFEEVSQAAIAAGVFGSPTYIVDGEVFFGQDRLDFVQKALAAPDKS
ncbi:MAG: 2-hydroxychromene-2-carboxylate isomerase [Pseudomonadota bacterium]